MNTNPVLKKKEKLAMMAFAALVPALKRQEDFLRSQPGFHSEFPVKVSSDLKETKGEFVFNKSCFFVLKKKKRKGEKI